MASWPPQSILQGCIGQGKLGYNHRNDEIRDNIVRMQRDREAYADALATVEQFNARHRSKEIENGL